MPRVRRHLRVIALVSVAVAVAAIVGMPAVLRYLKPPSAPTARPPQRLTIAVPLYLGYEPLHYGVDTGFWRKHGVDVILQDQNDVDVIAASLRSNTIDATMTTVDAVIHQKVTNLPGKIVLVTDRSNGADGIVARALSRVRAITDVSDARVGLQKGTASHYYLLKRLRELGTHGERMQIQDMSPDTIVAAMEAGSVDVVVTWHPYLAQLAARPNMRVIETTKKSSVGLYDVLYVTDTSLARKKSEWRSFAAAWFALLQEIEKNPAPFGAYIDKKFGTASGVHLSSLLRDFRFITASENVLLLTSDEKGLALTIDEVSALFRDADVIPRNVTASSAISPVLVSADD